MTTTHPRFDEYCGDTWQIEYTVRDGDGGALAIVDGMIFVWKLDLARVNVATLDNVTSGGITIIDAAQGRIGVLLAAEVTADLVPAMYHDELTLIDDAKVHTLCVGPIMAKAKLP